MEAILAAELASLISSLSEDNFKLLIKNFAKQYYKSNEVNLCDGPYDGGIDLIIFRDGKEIKRNIQITVQKTQIEKKIKADLVKAKENEKNHGYLNTLDYYISHAVSKSLKNNLTQHAQVECGIELKIIDAVKLGEDAEEFDAIKNTVYQLFQLPQGRGLKIDKQTKVLFDVLAIGGDAATVKKRFIKAFILSYLFHHPNSTVDQISNDLKDELSGRFDRKFYQDQLNYLKGKDIVKSSTDKRLFSLSDEANSKINDILSIAESQEARLINSISDFLASQGLPDSTEELMELLLKIYHENYDIDIREINSTSGSFGTSLRKCYENLFTFFRRNGVTNKEKCKTLTNKLLNICGENEYLSKIGVSVMFTSLFKSDQLQRYINETKQNVILDTQVLLRLFCVKLKEVEYEDVAYNSVKTLLETTDRYGDKITLMTTEDYVGEVAAHFLEAMKLERFLKLPYLESLGPSKNVFFNFYLFLRDAGITKYSSFKEFIEDLLGIEIPSVQSREFVQIVSKRLISLLEMLYIKTVVHPYYEDFQPLRKEYEIVLAYLKKDRSYSARENDLRTIRFLSSHEPHVDSTTGMRSEPFLVTWDSAFYDFRSTILNKFSNELYSWYLYSPLKLADRISVMNFKVNPQSINFNIVALAETNFEYSPRMVSFFDLISSFFNKDDISQLDLAKKLADLQEQIRKEDQEELFDDAPEKRSPLTDVLLEIRDYYVKPTSPNSLSDLIGVFEYSEFSDQIVEILNAQIVYFRQNRAVQETLFKELDQLIDQRKNTIS